MHVFAVTSWKMPVALSVEKDFQVGGVFGYEFTSVFYYNYFDLYCMNFHLYILSVVTVIYCISF